MVIARFIAADVVNSVDSISNQRKLTNLVEHTEKENVMQR